MTRAEPPKLVQATIEALLAIKEPDDEILIVDNNHQDRSLYQPLQSFCDSLDASLNVRFFHEDHIDGYKAGALNFALQKMDKRCQYIVVVDSDYQAMPWARQRIIKAISSHPNTMLFQFPQYYRDHCLGAKNQVADSNVSISEDNKAIFHKQSYTKQSKPDIHNELNHYFSYLLNKPHNRSRALSTGTFAVIDTHKLVAMGGWSANSITEDAQMGVLMHLNGEQTRYIPEVIASGLLPSNLADLIAQRRRWVYGNMQVLLGYPFLILQKLLSKPSNRHQDLNYRKLAKAQLTPINSTPNDLLIKKPQKLSSLSYSLPRQGNAPQLNGFSYTASSAPINKRQLNVLRAHLSQLCAWVNFTAPFIAAHGVLLAIFISILIVERLGLQTNYPLLDASLLSIPWMLSCFKVIYGAYFIFMVRRLVAYLKDSKPLLYPDYNDANQLNLSTNTIATNTVPQRLRAWLVHMSFWELGAFSWLPALWGQQKPFVCTPKLESHQGYKTWQATLKVVPKLLIVLNISTAVVVAPLSLPLFACAITVAGIKLLSKAVLVKSFK